MGNYVIEVSALPDIRIDYEKPNKVQKKFERNKKLKKFEGNILRKKIRKKSLKNTTQKNIILSFTV